MGNSKSEDFNRKRVLFPRNLAEACVKVRKGFCINSKTTTFSRKRVPAEVIDQPTKQAASIDITDSSECRYENKQTKLTQLKPNLSPRKFLERRMKARALSITRQETLKCAYWNEPTPLQLASYGQYLKDIVNDGDVELIDCILTAGVSPNPCNSDGDSMVHQICRLGNYEMLQMMLDHGCRVQVSNASGMTPLHEICRSKRPSFATAELLLEIDPNMFFMTDCKGYVPLSYVPKSQWDRWIQFLDARMDEFWPLHCTQSLDVFASSLPNSVPIQDPSHALSILLAKQVSSGEVDPEDAASSNRSS